MYVTRNRSCRILFSCKIAVTGHCLSDAPQLCRAWLLAWHAASRRENPFQTGTAPAHLSALSRFQSPCVVSQVGSAALLTGAAPEAQGRERPGAARDRGALLPADHGHPAPAAAHRLLHLHPHLRRHRRAGARKTPAIPQPVLDTPGNLVGRGCGPCAKPLQARFLFTNGLQADQAGLAVPALRVQGFTTCVAHAASRHTAHADTYCSSLIQRA